METINTDEEFNQSFPLVSNLIEQATYFLGVKNGEKAQVVNSSSPPNGIIVVPSDSNITNQLPQLNIRNPERLEVVMKEYIKTILKTDILYTKDKKDIDNYIFRVWPNATNYDFDNPDELYQRYISFIKDNTFKEYDNNVILGNLDDGSYVCAKKYEEELFLETPHTMRFVFQKENSVFYLPAIRYGIEDNCGEKIAYIYAIQRLNEYPKPEEYNEYQIEIDKNLRQINAGVKENREVSPAAIVVLSLFIGMLHKENITSIKVPDFLIGRWYAKSINSQFSEDELDKIQYNLTNKMLTNFLRLEDSFENFNINSFPNDIDSFLHITTSIPCKSNVPLLEKAYEIGLGSIEKNKSI